MVIKPSLCRLRQENYSEFQASQDAIIRQRLRKEGKKGQGEGMKGRKEERREGEVSCGKPSTLSEG